MKVVDSPAAAARLGDPTAFETTPGTVPAKDSARRRSIGWRIQPTEVDRHVGRRIRMQRILVGLTQHQLAQLIGVSYQQQHKYERGADRITAGRLHAIARALDVDVAHFFVGLRGRGSDEQDDLTLGLSRAFLAIRDKRHQQAVCLLARVLADEAEE